MMINTRNRAVEARTKDFLDGVNSSGDPPIYKLTPEAARKVLEDVQSGTVADPEVTESELTIVGPYGKELKIFSLNRLPELSIKTQIMATKNTKRHCQ